MMVFRVKPLSTRIFKEHAVIFLFALFLLIFPKGGFKLGDIPITWGYFFLGVGFLYALFCTKWVFQNPRVEALICLAPFQIVALFTLFVNGAVHMSWVVAFLISFVFLPFCFLCLYSRFIETMDLAFFFKVFRKGVFFISLYGVILLAFRLLTGKYFGIPFLTVNGGDSLELIDIQKCNLRSRFLIKLFSTYNNGQLFGICMTMVMPLYFYLEPSLLKRHLFRLSILLTLSRTACIGLVFCEFFYNFLVQENRKKALKNILFGFLMIGIIFLFFGQLFGLRFLLDQNLGGRKEQFEKLVDVNLFSSEPFSSILEVIYVSILYAFGTMGLITFLVGMIAPLIFYSQPFSLRIKRAILLGLAAYLFIALSDGALLYIPIMAFYWFLVSLLARKDWSLECQRS